MADAIEYGVFAGGYAPPQYQRQRFAGIKNPEVFTGKDFGIFYSRKSLALILGGGVPAGENSILYRVGHLAEETDGSAKINM